eukprot:SAG22_NODE_951_length_6344_cov_2.683747_3_plen_159_part_00
MAGCGLLAAMAARCVVRAAVWQNDETLWRAAVHAVPASARAHYNFGSALLPRTAAATAFIRALEIDPEYEPAWSNLGAAFEGRQQWQHAVLAYEAGLWSHRWLRQNNRSEHPHHEPEPPEGSEHVGMDGVGRRCVSPRLHDGCVHSTCLLMCGARCDS